MSTNTRIADALESIACLLGGGEGSPYTRAFHLVEESLDQGGDDFDAIKAAASVGYGEQTARMILGEVRLTRAGREIEAEFRDGHQIVIDERHLLLVRNLAFRWQHVMGGFPTVVVDSKRPYGSTGTLASMRRILDPDWMAREGVDTDEAHETNQSKWSQENRAAMLRLHGEVLCVVTIQIKHGPVRAGQSWQRDFLGRWSLVVSDANGSSEGE